MMCTNHESKKSQKRPSNQPLMPATERKRNKQDVPEEGQHASDMEVCEAQAHNEEQDDSQAGEEVKEKEETEMDETSDEGDEGDAAAGDDDESEGDYNPNDSNDENDTDNDEGDGDEEDDNEEENDEEGDEEGDEEDDEEQGQEDEEPDEENDEGDEYEESEEYEQNSSKDKDASREEGDEIVLHMEIDHPKDPPQISPIQAILPHLSDRPDLPALAQRALDCWSTGSQQEQQELCDTEGITVEQLEKLAHLHQLNQHNSEHPNTLSSVIHSHEYWFLLLDTQSIPAPRSADHQKKHDMVERTQVNAQYSQRDALNPHNWIANSPPTPEQQEQMSDSRKSKGQIVSQTNVQALLVDAVCIDIDNSSGLDELKRRFSGCLDEVAVESTSKGHHLYFVKDERMTAWHHQTNAFEAAAKEDETMSFMRSVDLLCSHSNGTLQGAMMSPSEDKQWLHGHEIHKRGFARMPEELFNFLNHSLQPAARFRPQVAPVDFTGQQSEWDDADDADGADGADGANTPGSELVDQNTLKQRARVLLKPAIEQHMSQRSDRPFRVSDSVTVLHHSQSDLKLQLYPEAGEPTLPQNPLCCSKCEYLCNLQVRPSQQLAHKGKLECAVQCNSCHYVQSKFEDCLLPPNLAALLQWPTERHFSKECTHFELLGVKLGATDEMVQQAFDRCKQGLCPDLDALCEPLPDDVKPSDREMSQIKGNLNTAMELVEKARAGLKTKLLRDEYAAQISTTGMLGESPDQFRERINTRELAAELKFEQMNRTYGCIMVGNQHQVLQMQVPTKDGESDTRFLDKRAFLDSLSAVEEQLMPGEREQAALKEALKAAERSAAASQGQEQAIKQAQKAVSVADKQAKKARKTAESKRERSSEAAARAEDKKTKSSREAASKAAEVAQRAESKASEKEQELLEARQDLEAAELEATEDVDGANAEATEKAVRDRFYQNLTEVVRAQYCAESQKVPKLNHLGQPQKLAHLWFQSTLRREFAGGVVFDPRMDSGIVTHPKTRHEMYNMWRGFAVQPKEGECSLIFCHVKDILAAGSDEVNEYILDWCATVLQIPWKRLKVALVLRGAQGSGKGTLAVDIMKHIFGQHGKHLINKEQFVGRFNAHFKDAGLIVLDEAFFSGDKQIKGLIKALCTETTINIEAKNKDTITVDFFANLIFTSNEDVVVPMDSQERRYVVIQADERYAGDHTTNPEAQEYFEKLHHEINNGGREAFLHAMLNRDVSKFNPRALPTATGTGHEKMKFDHVFSGSDPIERFWYERLKEGQLLPELGQQLYEDDTLESHFVDDNWEDLSHEQLLWPKTPGGYVQFDRKSRHQPEEATIVTKSLHHAYKDFCDTINERYKKSERVFVEKLEDLMPGTDKKLQHRRTVTVTAKEGTVIKNRVQALEFPPLKACRQQMEKHWKLSAQVMWS